MRYQSNRTYLFLWILLGAFFIGCSKSETAKPKLSLNATEVKLNYDEEFQFVLKRGEEVISFSSVTTSSTDEFVGRVNNSGVFEAQHVGETDITLVHEGESIKAKIIVEPIYTFFQEPFNEFGKGKSQIKSLEKRRLLFEDTNGLIYSGENNRVEYIGYLFENNRLKGSIVDFKNSRIYVNDIMYFYDERYTFEGEEDDIYLFTNKSKNIVVGLTIANAELRAAYIPYNGQLNAQSILKAMQTTKQLISGIGN